MASVLERLKKDIRFVEGLNSCINCGVCTAVCPAAQFYNYDPRMIADTVQKGNETEIEQLLKSDTIWFCGECLSCKTRCPRGNTPGYIIQALRALSIETGFFIESEQGRKQLALKRTIGEHILKYGYCVYIDEIDTEMHPEQGPIWDWFKQNRIQMLERLGANYQKTGSGTLRQISKESLDDLQRIFDETGATERFDKIEKQSAIKANELGMDRNEYFDYLYNGDQQ
jgi:heterodisulfide reductase subunit C